jgi:hypothetical protein
VAELDGDAHRRWELGQDLVEEAAVGPQLRR